MSPYGIAQVIRGAIVAASTTLLADSRTGRRGGLLRWALLAVGSVASLAANVAVAEPSLIGRVIAAWPSFALTASYKLLTRQVRRSAPKACHLRMPFAAQMHVGISGPRRNRIMAQRTTLSGAVVAAADYRDGLLAAHACTDGVVRAAWLGSADPPLADRMVVAMSTTLVAETQ